MKRISVRRSSVHGRGVFALRPLFAGEFILEYTGTVMSRKRAISRHRRFGEEGHTFLFGLSDGRVLDGSLGGNSARWLNHACVANCEAVEDNGRVYIQAVSDIQPGEELFIAYGLTTEGRASAAVRAQYACRCGHRRCRGTMLAGSSLRFSDSFKVEQAN
ncbi:MULTISPECIES: SET domain-containing protein [Paraburkholderia]|uniref:SET domain-containing protein n=1 Tax=Paraburkholderia podalyriae TaxID=1938811 RepID=A0ABR7Q2W7_9BURK|nr:SET domain-containing protein-lysine N-methyltransferase [Paraburkholderia podalyriae]MBC8752895.1 SET domain-containing protein [Paraburkholderia podalyriae]